MNSHFAWLSLEFAALIVCGASLLFAAQQLPMTSVPFVETDNPEWGYINDVEFSPDSHNIVVASDNGLWLLDEHLQVIGDLQGYLANIHSVSWNIEGTLLASGGEDGTIRLWDMVETSPTYLSSVKTLQDSGPVYFVDWSPNESPNQIATRTVTDREASSASIFVLTDVRVWNVQTEQIERTIGSLANGATELAWSTDGNMLAGAGLIEGGYILHIWNAQDGDIITSFSRLDRIRSVAWRPNSQIVAFSDFSGLTTLFDINAAYPTNMFGYETGTTQLATLDWDPDGNRFAVGSRVGYVLIYDANTGQIILQMNNHVTPINRLDWSGDNNKIAITSGNTSIRILDVSSLPAVPELPTITPYPTLSITPSLVP